MARYISINIHTENLAAQKTFNRVKKLVKFLNKRRIKATWFVIAGQERLKYLIKQGQAIEQHTHFYKSGKGAYDLSRENVLAKLRRDKQWLENRGVKVQGFVSGAWQINDEVWQILASHGYQYDLSLNNMDLKNPAKIEKKNGLLVVPATASIRRLLVDLFTFRPSRRFLKYQNIKICCLHFHDYDLNSFIKYLALRFLISAFSLFGYKFITISELL